MPELVALIEQHFDAVAAARFRGTQVLQREADDAWHIVHEHFSRPAADGTGDWLSDAGAALPTPKAGA
jgi:ketosteroid isomerase-like protein